MYVKNIPICTRFWALVVGLPFKNSRWSRVELPQDHNVLCLVSHDQYSPNCWQCQQNPAQKHPWSARSHENDELFCSILACNKNSRIHWSSKLGRVFFLRGKQNHPSHPRIRRVKTFLLVSWSRKKMWINVGQISRRGNWPMVTMVAMSPQNHEKYRFWPPNNQVIYHENL